MAGWNCSATPHVHITFSPLAVQTTACIHRKIDSCYLSRAYNHTMPVPGKQDAPKLPSKVTVAHDLWIVAVGFRSEQSGLALLTETSQIYNQGQRPGNSHLHLPRAAWTTYARSMISSSDRHLQVFKFHFSFLRSGSRAFKQSKSKEIRASKAARRTPARESPSSCG